MARKACPCASVPAGRRFGSVADRTTVASLFTQPVVPWTAAVTTASFLIRGGDGQRVVALVRQRHRNLRRQPAGGEGARLGVVIQPLQGGTEADRGETAPIRGGDRQVVEARIGALERIHGDGRRVLVVR